MDSNGLELLEADVNGVQAIATSHFFFHDDDYTPVAHINQAGIRFLCTDAGRIADKKRDARLALLSQVPTQCGVEKQLEKTVMARLQADGQRPESQKHCRHGTIDIFIPGDPPSIIELKASGSQANIRQAIGQLAFYSSEWPSANLFIAAVGGLDAATKSVIARFEIGEWI